MIYARPKSSALALLQVCTREATQRQQLVAGALIFLKAIEPIQAHYYLTKTPLTEAPG